MVMTQRAGQWCALRTTHHHRRHHHHQYRPPRAQQAAGRLTTKLVLVALPCCTAVRTSPLRTT